MNTRYLMMFLAILPLGLFGDEVKSVIIQSFSMEKNINDSVVSWKQIEKFDTIPGIKIPMKLSTLVLESISERISEILSDSIVLDEDNGIGDALSGCLCQAPTDIYYIEISNKRIKASVYCGSMKFLYKDRSHKISRELNPAIFIRHQHLRDIISNQIGCNTKFSEFEFEWPPNSKYERMYGHIERKIRKKYMNGINIQNYNWVLNNYGNVEVDIKMKTVTVTSNKIKFKVEIPDRAFKLYKKTCKKSNNCQDMYSLKYKIFEK